MSVASEITRLQGVKANILTAICNKGIFIPVGSVLDDCPDLISGIPSSGVDKLSIQSLTDNIVNGRITNTSSNQGIFLIPQIDYDSYSVWERNFRFVINAFNQYDNAVYSGEFFTGNISIPSPMGAAYNPNGCKSQ
jgi:hypothetical protein